MFAHISHHMMVNYIKLSSWKIISAAINYYSIQSINLFLTCSIMISFLKIPTSCSRKRFHQLTHLALTCWLKVLLIWIEYKWNTSGCVSVTFTATEVSLPTASKTCFPKTVFRIHWTQLLWHFTHPIASSCGICELTQVLSVKTVFIHFFHYWISYYRYSKVSTLSHFKWKQI